MAVLNSCCCWNNVRTGSIAVGIYTLIFSLVNGGIVGYNISFIQYYSTQLNGTMIDSIVAANGWNYTSLCVTVLLAISSVILIIGVHKDERRMLIPWLASIAAVIILDTAALIYECTSLAGFLTFNVIQMVIWLALTLLNVYSILCVVSQYQELKAGRGRLIDIRRQRAMIVYQNGIQQVHITQGPIVMTYRESYITATGQRIPVNITANGQSIPASGQSVPVNGGPSSVVVTPPEYSIVAGYASQADKTSTTDISSTGQEQQESLLPQTDSPPPPYIP